MELAKQLAEKTNYLNKDILYLKNTMITEYDIKSAGFTVIKNKKLLPEEEILELEQMDKEKRNIWIGKRILSFPKISEEIINGLSDIRKDFVVLNNILENEILSIKKDALFLINKNPNILKIGIFEFRAKETFTSYCFINKKEFYYSSRKDEMEIKGISDESRNYHKNYILKDIKKIISMSEKLTADQMFTFLKNYRSKYLNRELNKETYRDLETNKFLVDGYYLEDISDEMLPSIDLSQNYLNYLLPLFNLIV
jgi:hypothetical protein